MQNKQKSLCVLVLAAGKGTRMHSKTPKVLQQMLEEPILSYPLSALQNAGFKDIAVMVGFEGELVETFLLNKFPDVKVLWQKEQLGTGHAAKIAQPWWQGFDNVMILTGDTPLITAETLKNFAESHIRSCNKCDFLSFELDDPTGYGRIIRDGMTIRIVEEKDATLDERKCKEVNSGMYIFDTDALSSVIDKISCGNIQKEYYLPDAVSLIEKNGGTVDAIKTQDAFEFVGINDPVQLADATVIMRNRILNMWMHNGVRCFEPSSVWIGPNVQLSADITLEPNVQLWGSTTIGSGSRVGSFSVLRNAKIGNETNIIGSVRINDSRVGNNCSVGPFVFMRNNAVLADGALAGRYVEIKNSTISEGSKVPHLSYVGDATVGRNTNLGAGTITCNYDGRKKNKTTIGDNCLVGSDTMFVAPVNVGDDAMTGAGSVITEDIPSGALGVGRARQRNIDGWKAIVEKKNNPKGGNK
jgi:bifunctional UDP-N-acetylglucosamine pyrophosphorylase/glucosamine-1-phosphate N-acetyltransferase